MSSRPLPGEIYLRLFPLPNFVFFPRTQLPLHVFEPRYCQLVADSLETDQRFGIVLLQPGWESDYHGAPPVHSWGTMGGIGDWDAFDDGRRYNVVLHGDMRFRIIEELQQTPYRAARVVLSPEVKPSAEESDAQRTWVAELSQQYLRYLPNQIPVPEIELLDLDALTNTLILSLNLDMEKRQKLLELDQLVQRAEAVASELQSRIETLRFLAPFRQDAEPGRN